MSGRWPDPVREPLPVGLVSEKDIDEALRLTVRFLCEPEDPAFDQATFGFVTAARAALIECSEILGLAEAGRQVDAEAGETPPDYRRWQDIGQEYVARKVARRVIDQLRQWVPERTIS